MKTRIHFAVLNLSKMVLNYRKNFVKSCTINFMMQTAVMGTYTPAFKGDWARRIQAFDLLEFPGSGVAAN